MARSAATTVAAYLDELPPERRTVVAAVRDMVLQHLPRGYRETMSWGMISYEVPLERHAKTYNGQPLVYAAIAAQKSHYALYLMGVSIDPAREQELHAAYRRAGKKLDLGKSCLRFKQLEDLPLQDLGTLIASLPVAEFIERSEAARAGAVKKGKS